MRLVGGAATAITHDPAHTPSSIQPHHLQRHQVDLDKFQADPEGYLRGVATFAVQGIVERCVLFGKGGMEGRGGGVWIAGGR